MATPRDSLAVDDVVRIGKGTVTWTIVGFGTWPSTGEEYADLKSVEGYANTTASPERLTIVGGAR